MGEQIGAGDTVATRLNSRDLGVANRDTWTVLAVTDSGELQVAAACGRRTLPASYVRDYVELAYATTAYGAQGQTVDTAHVLVTDGMGAAMTYVGMTRGRHRNVAHLVAESADDAREQWARTFSRDRADLGPRHATGQALADIQNYGSAARRPPASTHAVEASPSRTRERTPTIGR
jgi:ATP-dependent exoDNAse (exonuclease V) alpha subunit